MDQLVFVYGTLKRNERNFFVMRDHSNGRYVGECSTSPEYSMINLGFYPAVLSGGVHSIKGEVFEVDDLAALDHLEGYPNHYDRKMIDTPFGPAWMYYMTRTYHNCKYPLITSGEWSGDQARRFGENVYADALQD